MIHDGYLCVIEHALLYFLLFKLDNEPSNLFFGVVLFEPAIDIVVDQFSIETLSD